VRKSHVGSALIALFFVLGCGDSDGGGGSESEAPPPPSAKAIAQARAGVQAYCTQVAAYAVGRRGPPTDEEFDAVSAAIDRLAERAELSPEVLLPDGSTPRLALGDLAEDLEGTNCDSRLVALIDERLASLPPD
jgi:hypothetical protein